MKNRIHHPQVYQAWVGFQPSINMVYFCFSHIFIVITTQSHFYVYDMIKMRMVHPIALLLLYKNPNTWRFPKMVLPPNHPFYRRIFHHKPFMLRVAPFSGKLRSKSKAAPRAGIP